MCNHSHGEPCSHASDNSDLSASFSLYKYINMHNLECLNEAVAGTGRAIFKPHENRKDSTVFVESDADEELLFNIPFTGNVKLTGIIIAGEASNHHPREVVLYKNRPFMTFSDTDDAGDQAFGLAIDPHGDAVYPLKASRFGTVHSLTIHIKSNFGEPTTRLHYIGLRGDFTPATKQEVVIANYELRPSIADHKADLMESNSHFIQ